MELQLENIQPPVETPQSDKDRGVFILDYEIDFTITSANILDD